MKRRTLLKSLVAAPLAAAIPSALAIAAPDFSEITPRIAIPNEGWQMVEFVSARVGGKGSGERTFGRTDRIQNGRAMFEKEFSYFAVHPDHGIALNLKEYGNVLPDDISLLEHRYEEVLEWKRMSRDEKDMFFRKKFLIE